MRHALLWLLGPIVSVFALAYLFNASNGNASSWILWEKTMPMKDGDTTTAWEPLEGFDRLADCHRSGLGIVQTARDFMNSGGRTLVAVRPDGRSAVYRLWRAERSRPSITDSCASPDRSILVTNAWFVGVAGPRRLKPALYIQKLP